MRNGGDVVVETLAALGVSHVFGIPGQHALGLFDAIRRSDLTFVSSRIENNSAFGADGYARATGEVGVIFLSTGPGALTALGALQEAYATGVPLLVITSQVPRDGLGLRRGMLHQLDDQQRSAINVTKSTAVVRRGAEIPSLLADAFALAQSAPAGPTWVEIPQDVLLDVTDVPPVTTVVTQIAERPPRAELITEAAALLDAASRPVILAGGGVRRSPGGSAALTALAERLGAPVVSTVGGKGAIRFDHPLSAASWIEDRYTTQLLEDADVLLAVGTAMGEVTSNYFTFRPKGRLIHVDAEPRVLEANHPGLGIHADAALALEAMAKQVSQRDRSAGERAAAELRTSVQRRLAEQDLGTELALIRDLRAAVPAAAHTFWDMTIAAYWAWSAWDPLDGEFHSAQGAGGLGFGYPAAIAAAIGSGERTFAVSGDGGAMYSIAELATARQHDADVTWLIVDDGGYGILREYMTDAFGQATATELSRPDFAALAASFGIPAHVATLDTVGEIVAGTFTTPGPAVVVLPALLHMFSPTHLPKSAPTHLEESHHG
ncbi:thiamine pyrophosphate-binding protein [Mycobacterium sp. AZCC_0083]|uniref:thiamine pyrophosphate-binding protein n=1 Tax=Mycobacterium sp. AZCC_0083 TaxID=2735882 RepID=UPI00160C6F9A|nr:thiamine pyrophosphate-binding protein [Mycobacterium sp. AZCC_0083]MBB5163763.1 acetolactate synthase-1/2/3 large subunit [Mycobacterium sp. AZCC_0083]